MARRRPGLVAMRRIVAGAFLFVGLFVLCFGLGNGRQSVMVAGVAIVVLASIGRLATSFRRTTRQWVQGTGIVVSVSDPPAESRYGRCQLELVVDAPGMGSETVPVHESRVPVAQWPRAGQELPVQVAADDIRNVRVLWRDYLSGELVPQEPAEEPGDAFWEDDQPTPVPAEPPGSHLDPPDTAVIDFDLDNPPADPLAPAPAAASTADLGEVDHGMPSPPGPVVPPPRKPSPRPRPHQPPAATAGPASRRATATATATSPTISPTTAATLDPEISDLVTTYPSAHPGPAGAINGVGVTVLVADLDRSVAFYRDTLGFYEVDGGEGNLVLASGQTRLVLRQAPELGTVNRRLVHLNLEVADIDAMYAELKGNGIRFTYPPKPVNRSARLELWAAAFQDPDGHGIAITQWRPAASAAPSSSPI